MKNSSVIAALLLCAYLGLYNGYVALFNLGEDTPKEVFPYRAALYPQIDRQALEKGIPIHDPKQLKSRLEDFLS